MFMLNDKPLPLDTPFTVGEGDEAIQYPANWLRLSTAEEKAAIGITEATDPVPYDDRFYWGVDNPKALEDKLEVKEDGTPLYVQEWDAASESMVDTTVQVVTKGLKSNHVAQVKATAGSLLATTDWMVIRKAERDVAIPEDVIAQRAAIVTECTRLEAAIAECTDVPSLIDVVTNQSWSVKAA